MRSGRYLLFRQRIFISSRHNILKAFHDFRRRKDDRFLQIGIIGRHIGPIRQIDLYARQYPSR